MIGHRHLTFRCSSMAGVFLLGCLLFTGCSAPRSVTVGPAATPKGSFAFGGDVGMTLPTQTARSLYGSLEDQVKSIADQDGDTVAVEKDELNAMVEALFAYSLDPIGTRTELWLRYGLGSGLDAGYRYASGAHAFDVRWQFLGRADEPTLFQSLNTWQGSLALQYCGQTYALPSLAGLDKLQSLLHYEFKRKDLLIPLVFGKPLGEKGRAGSFGFGLAYNHSWIAYESEILRIVEKLDGGATRPYRDLRGESSIPSYGGFLNGRLGWEHVFLVGGLSVFYQDYGSFRLFGEETAELKGWTWLPTLGLEVRL